VGGIQSNGCCYFSKHIQFCSWTSCKYLQSNGCCYFSKHIQFCSWTSYKYLQSNGCCYFSKHIQFCSCTSYKYLSFDWTITLFYIRKIECSWGQDFHTHYHMVVEIVLRQPPLTLRAAEHSGRYYTLSV